MIKYIIWDVDGTLYQEVPRLSQDLDESYVKRLESYWGLSYAQIQPVYKARKKVYKSSTMAVASLTCETPASLTDYFESYVPYQNYIRHDERIVETFRSMPGIIHYAYRNGSTQQTKKILAMLGLQEIERHGAEFGPFEKVWGTVSMTGVTKPHMLVFDIIHTYLYHRHGLYKERPFTEEAMREFSSQVLLVGDRPEVDLEKAKEVGMQTALVWHKKPEGCTYVDYELETVYDILSLVTT